MNNVSFLSSSFFLLELFAHCDLAFGPVTDWWAIFGARTTAGGMRDEGVGSNKRGRGGRKQNMMPPSHHSLSHQILEEAICLALNARPSPYSHSKYNVIIIFQI